MEPPVKRAAGDVERPGGAPHVPCDGRRRNPEDLRYRVHAFAGWLDRAALPEPTTSPDHSARPFVAPRTHTEAVLAEMWSELLAVERVSVDDDFFELGGHSLLVTQVVARVHQILNVDVPVRALFDAPTLAEFATATTACEAVPGQTERIAALTRAVAAMSDDTVVQTLQPS